jgi:lipopolysaccharide export LptBFGC system permease protein LptF
VAAREAAQSGNLNRIKALSKIRRDIGERLSFPLMCLAVSIVAAPLGARAQRSGRSFTFASGVAIVAIYFVLRTTLKDALPSIPAPSLPLVILVTQIPNLILVSVGLLLTWRVDRL